MSIVPDSGTCVDEPGALLLIVPSFSRTRRLHDVISSDRVRRAQRNVRCPEPSYARTELNEWPSTRGRLREVDEAEGFVAVGDAGVGQRGAPVAGDGRIRLLHPMVGDEEESSAVPNTGLLDDVEDMAQPRVAVTNRRERDFRMRPTLVER